MSSLMTMQAAVSSVNCGLNVKPSLLKNAIERLRSFTGRFTKILVAISAPSKGWIGDSLRRGEFLCPAAPPVDGQAASAAGGEGGAESRHAGRARMRADQSRR